MAIFMISQLTRQSQIFGAAPDEMGRHGIRQILDGGHAVIRHVLVHRKSVDFVENDVETFFFGESQNLHDQLLGVNRAEWIVGIAQNDAGDLLSPLHRQFVGDFHFTDGQFKRFRGSAV